jgi:hypothetical protein
MDLHNLGMTIGLTLFPGVEKPWELLAMLTSKLETLFPWAAVTEEDGASIGGGSGDDGDGDIGSGGEDALGVAAERGGLEEESEEIGGLVAFDEAVLLSEEMCELDPDW